MSELQMMKADAAKAGQDKSDFKSWLGGIFRGDGWMNVLTGIGMRNRDKRTAMSIGARPVLSREELEGWFHQDDLTATICELPSKEMTREWVTLTIPHEENVDEDPATAVMTTMNKMEFRTKLREALTWSKLYGGSIILLGVDDGSEDMSQPLNEDSIASFEWMTVLDRWDVQVDRYYNDPAEPKYGEVETYRIVNDIGEGGASYAAQKNGKLHHNQVWHESRILRFDGALTSRRRRRENAGWSDSVIERMRDTIRDFNGSFASVSHLVQDFAQAVFKIRGLADMLAHDQDELVLKRLRLIDMSRSVGRAVPLDAEGEDFERKSTPMHGLPEILDRQMMRLSSATRMPVTLLFGRSAAGMNSTGESDVRMFYDNIGADQEDSLRCPIERVVKLLFLSKDGPTSGELPPQWSIAFNPLWQESAHDRALTRKTIAETDAIYVDMGAVVPLEVRGSRWSGDEFNHEMQIVKIRDEEGGDAMATVNELSLTIERAARIGDIDMVNSARRALAKRLGVTEIQDVTVEVLGATIERLREREAAGEAQGRADSEIDDLRRRNAPNYQTAPEILEKGEISLQDLENADFSVCDNCGFEKDGVCRVFSFAVDPDHVCDSWVDATEFSVDDDLVQL